MIKSSLKGVLIISMNKLKELRKERGLSQQALAKKLGVHYRTLQNWENGESQIKTEKAQQLANYFGVSVAYLLGFSDEKIGYIDSNSDDLTEMGREYARFYLHDKSLEQFENLIRKNSEVSEITKKDEDDFFVQVDPAFIIHKRITDIYDLLAISPREYQEFILAWSCLDYEEQRKILNLLNVIISNKFDDN